MLKRTLGTAGVLIVLAGAAFAFSPAMRAKLTGQWDRMAGWSKAAREADPVGFVKYAEAKLKKDLEKMEILRRGLAAEVGTITKKTRQQSALAEQAQMLAEEFRGAYQQAKAGGGFPIEVRGEAYTEPQVRSQVSLLLAESEGYADSLGEMVDVRGEAQERMEELTVRIGKTESQLAGLAAKRELLRARKLTLEGEELLAQVDELMVANRQAVAGNPIRTATELVAAGRKSSKTRASEQKVEAFLAGTYSAKPLPKLSVELSKEVQATFVSEQQTQPAPPKTKQKPVPECSTDKSEEVQVAPLSKQEPQSAAPQSKDDKPVPESITDQSEEVQATLVSEQEPQPVAPKTKQKPAKKQPAPESQKPIFQQS